MNIKPQLEQKYIVAIIISLIIGGSILGYGYLNNQTKIKILEQERQMKEEEQQAEAEKEYKKLLIRKTQLQTCQDEAEENYTSWWASNCENFGSNKKDDGSCSLPSYLADTINEAKQKELDNCVKLYPAN